MTTVISGTAIGFKELIGQRAKQQVLEALEQPRPAYGAFVRNPLAPQGIKAVSSMATRPDAPTSGPALPLPVRPTAATKGLTPR